MSRVISSRRDFNPRTLVELVLDYAVVLAPDLSGPVRSRLSKRCRQAFVPLLTMNQVTERCHLGMESRSLFLVTAGTYRVAEALACDYITIPDFSFEKLLLQCIGDNENLERSVAHTLSLPHVLITRASLIGGWVGLSSLAGSFGTNRLARLRTFQLAGLTEGQPEADGAEVSHIVFAFQDLYHVYSPHYSDTLKCEKLYPEMIVPCTFYDTRSYAPIQLLPALCENPMNSDYYINDCRFLGTYDASEPPVIGAPRLVIRGASLHYPFNNPVDFIVQKGNDIIATSKCLQHAYQAYERLASIAVIFLAKELSMAIAGAQATYQKIVAATKAVQLTRHSLSRPGDFSVDPKRVMSPGYDFDYINISEIPIPVDVAAAYPDFILDYDELGYVFGYRLRDVGSTGTGWSAWNPAAPLIMGQLRSYKLDPDKDAVQFHESDDVIIIRTEDPAETFAVPRNGRALTTFQLLNAITRLLHLHRRAKSLSSGSRPFSSDIDRVDKYGVPVYNDLSARRTGLDQGDAIIMEDKAKGQCSICGVGYSNYLDHVRSQLHLTKYREYLTQLNLLKPLQLCAALSEQKTSMEKQLCNIAMSIVSHERIPYGVVVEAMNQTLAALRFRIQLDPDDVPRSASPTCRTPSFTTWREKTLRRQQNAYNEALVGVLEEGGDKPDERLVDLIVTGVGAYLRETKSLPTSENQTDLVGTALKEYTGTLAEALMAAGFSGDQIRQREIIKREVEARLSPEELDSFKHHALMTSQTRVPFRGLEDIVPSSVLYAQAKQLCDRGEVSSPTEPSDSDENAESHATTRKSNPACSFAAYSECAHAFQQDHVREALNAMYGYFDMDDLASNWEDPNGHGGARKSLQLGSSTDGVAQDLRTSLQEQVEQHKGRVLNAIQYVYRYLVQTRCSSPLEAGMCGVQQPLDLCDSVVGLSGLHDSNFSQPETTPLQDLRASAFEASVLGLLDGERAPTSDGDGPAQEEMFSALAGTFQTTKDAAPASIPFTSPISESLLRADVEKLDLLLAEQPGPHITPYFASHTPATTTMMASGDYDRNSVIGGMLRRISRNIASERLSTGSEDTDIQSTTVRRQGAALQRLLKSHVALNQDMTFPELLTVQPSPHGRVMIPPEYNLVLKSDPSFLDYLALFNSYDNSSNNIWDDKALLRDVLRVFGGIGGPSEPLAYGLVHTTMDIIQGFSEEEPKEVENLCIDDLEHYGELSLCDDHFLPPRMASLQRRPNSIPGPVRLAPDSLSLCLLEDDVTAGGEYSCCSGDIVEHIRANLMVPYDAPKEPQTTLYSGPMPVRDLVHPNTKGESTTGVLTSAPLSNSETTRMESDAIPEVLTFSSLECARRHPEQHGYLSAIIKKLDFKGYPYPQFCTIRESIIASINSGLIAGYFLGTRIMISSCLAFDAVYNSSLGVANLEAMIPPIHLAVLFAGTVSRLRSSSIDPQYDTLHPRVYTSKLVAEKLPRPALFDHQAFAAGLFEQSDLDSIQPTGSRSQDSLAPDAQD
ncbi:hypothetical protein GMRT_15867 [Giardia muris]|uniref:Uncharacterized protein n=1 Tax=Giardia muris TaxID=5742 RepID=A0A4Z1SYS5_GIAMU|nr:hypothetical protein GMRT_15867 [Giardia muris]|eukprot:TNJ29915.1 hypothetical protein GMRT_15867 [Giardia muris]